MFSVALLISIDDEYIAATHLYTFSIDAPPQVYGSYIFIISQLLHYIRLEAGL
jgi:hypothetical protein